jgi:cytosine/adenosine deaminase-related metal-dependent hydrolase
MDELIVEGCLLDAAGPRPGYARFRGDRLTETGMLGTDSTRGRVRRVRGIVTPAPVNGHTHLGDAVATREPPHTSLAAIVRPPDGYKFQLLTRTPAARKTAAMRAALVMMGRQGVAATVDFREEGVAGLEQIRAAARGTGVRCVVLGRPLRRPLVRPEVDEVLRLADGIGLSSVQEEPLSVRRALASACAARDRYFALHASESVREPVDAYLRPRPDLLVHLAKATRADLEQVAREGVTVAVCPRSNALFGRRPDLALFERVGVPTMIGTDNAMFHSPSIWRELEFAYVTARLARRPVRPDFLFRAAFVAPWEWLGTPEQAHLDGGGSVRALAFRLPTDDPAYQVVARATEHLMVRPGASRRP